jgi:prophage regulatory protein
MSNLSNNSNSERIRLPEVIKRTGLSRSTIYRRAGDNTFPKHIILGANASGWLESEISEWIANQMKLSRQPPP